MLLKMVWKLYLTLHYNCLNKKKMLEAQVIHFEINNTPAHEP